MAQALIQYVRDSYQELKIVVWPDRKQTINHSLLVILFSVLISLFLSALDILFTFGIEKLILLR